MNWKRPNKERLSYTNLSIEATALFYTGTSLTVKTAQGRIKQQRHHIYKLCFAVIFGCTALISIRTIGHFLDNEGDAIFPVRTALQRAFLLGNCERCITGRITNVSEPICNAQ